MQKKDKHVRWCIGMSYTTIVYQWVKITYTEKENT